MMTHRDRVKKAIEILDPIIKPNFEVKLLSVKNGDFGDLESLRFDAEECGGFLDFWSSGMVQYELVDYASGAEIIPIVVLENVSDQQIEDIATLIARKLADSLE